MSVIVLTAITGGGVTYSIEALDVDVTVAVPASLLPSGVVAGTEVYADGVKYSVLGAKATVDALIAAASPSIEQPASRVYAGAADTIVAADVGGVVFYTGAAGVTVNLPTLAASLLTGRMLLLSFQAEGAATILTVDPGTGVTINGSTSNYVAATGRTRVSLFSRDGLAWFTG